MEHTRVAKQHTARSIRFLFLAVISCKLYYFIQPERCFLFVVYRFSPECITTHGSLLYFLPHPHNISLNILSLCLSSLHLGITFLKHSKKKIKKEGKFLPILAAYKIVCTINKNEPSPPRGVARGRELGHTCRRGEVQAYIITHTHTRRVEACQDPWKNGVNRG